MAALTLTVPEAARALGISRSLAYAMAAEGRIPTIQFGRRTLVPKVALERMLLEVAERYLDGEVVPQTPAGNPPAGGAGAQGAGPLVHGEVARGSAHQPEWRAS